MAQHTYPGLFYEYTGELVLLIHCAAPNRRSCNVLLLLQEIHSVASQSGNTSGLTRLKN